MIKAGVKTSEFILGLVVTTALFLNSFFKLGLDEGTVTRIVALVISYILGRSAVKIANGKE